MKATTLEFIGGPRDGQVLTFYKPPPDEIEGYELCKTKQCYVFKSLSADARIALLRTR